MNNVLLHGLGQNSDSWKSVISYLNKKNISAIAPDIFQLCENNNSSYNELYKSFSTYCNNLKGKINLCGLSLGGILALDYAKRNPNKVNSLIIIGVPYVIPKKLFKFQNFIFKLMPNKTFINMELTKRKFLSLVNSMSELEISKDLNRIQCKTLIIYGKKDKPNIKYLNDFNKSIKNGKTIIIDNSSHEVNKDNPNELSNSIIDFWNS